MKNRLENCFLLPPLAEQGLSISEIFLLAAEQHPKISYDFEPLTEETVGAAESTLKITFSPGFRELLLYAGARLQHLEWSDSPKAKIYSLPEIVHNNSQRLTRKEKKYLEIGETGYNQDHSELKEMICLDLEKDEVFAEEAEDAYSSQEFVMRTFWAQYFMKAFRYSGRARSVKPSFERNPVRNSIGPKVVKDIDQVLIHDFALKRNPLSGGRYYYYSHEDAGVSMMLSPSPYPDQQCIIQIEMWQGYRNKLPKLQDQLREAAVFSGFDF